MSEKIAKPDFHALALSYCQKHNCLDVAIVSGAIELGFKLAVVNVKVQIADLRSEMNKVRRIANGPQ